MSFLSPLPYHRRVADIIVADNPASIAALTAPRASAERTETDEALLRSTYRLEEAAHADVHAAVRRAARALEMDLPIELYVAEGGSGPNAELLFVPGRVILLFSGLILESLSTDELVAVAGHELAHYLLWTMEDGRYLATSRLLDAAEGDARTPTEYLESTRRFRLATELYADRAAYLVTGSLQTAVTALVRVTTGMRRVDADSYLRQAAEVDLSRGSSGVSHPETVLRAWALQQWAEERGPSDVVEARVQGIFAPPLDLTTLDLLGQDELLRLTRDLVGAMLDRPGLDTPEVTAIAEQYAVFEPTEPPELPEGCTPETRRYLCAVLLDLATADADHHHDVLAQALHVAGRTGLRKDLLALITKELGLGDRERADLLTRADALSTAVADQDER